MPGKTVHTVPPKFSPKALLGKTRGLRRPCDHRRIACAAAGAAEVTTEEPVGPAFSAVCGIVGAAQTPRLLQL